MLVFILQKAKPAIKGKLTQWLVEIQPGVYIGDVSTRVREILWEEIKKAMTTNSSAIMAHSSNNEQGYKLETIGNTKYNLVDFDGIILTCKPT